MEKKFLEWHPNPLTNVNCVFYKGNLEMMNKLNYLTILRYHNRGHNSIEEG